MPFWDRKRVRWIRKGLKQYMPYVPYNPKPKPPPPYVPPPRDLTITAPVQGSTVNDDTPAITGTTTGTGAVTVTIAQGGTTVQTLGPVTPSGGSWVTTATHLNDGLYTATATQTIGGQLVTASKSFTVNLVIPPPPPPQVAILVPSAGSTTQDNTPTIAGTATGTTVVTVLVKQAGITVQTLSPTPSGGTWTTTATTLADGVYTVEAAQTVSGVTGNATPVVFTVDVGSPAVVVTSVAGGPPASSTTDTTPTIVGTAGVRVEDSTTVTVQVRQGASVIQTLTPTRSGANWTTTPTALAVGSYQIRATQASSFGTGTSSDFPFTVSATQAVPAPTISTPMEGQTLTGSVVFTGIGGVAQGDSPQVTVRVYPIGSNTQQAQATANVIHGGQFDTAWTTQTQPISLPNGNWRARVEQGGTAGLGVSPFRNFTMAVSTSVGLAMPRGPVNGFAGAADFYDSVGVCHHPNYFNNGDVSDPATDAAIGAMQELGVRHVRLGLDSPATHGNTWRSQQFLMRERVIRGSNQPIHALWGTPTCPKQRRDQPGTEIYTVTDTDGTFLRPLDGPSGNVSAENWSVAEGGGKKYSAGTFYDVGWEGAAGLQGANEPDNGYENGVESHRWIMSAMQSAKNARTNETVLSGGSYVDHNTGRIVAGSAKAPQIPMVSAAIINASPPGQPSRWPIWGNYADRADVDVGSFPIYWGGHSPIYDEEWALNSGSRWGQREGFNGSMASGSIVAGDRFVNSMPMFVTETGYIQRPGTDPGGGQRYAPADVAGEYMIRTLLQNYITTVAKRTYLFSLHDVGEGNIGGADPNGRMGLCGSLTNTYTNTFPRRASFHAIKNLLAIVGFRQGSTSASITVPHTYTNGPSQSMPSKTVVDRLDKLILQTADNEYLIILTRQSQIWDRDAQTYMTPGARDAVLTLPAGTWTCSIAEPAKQAVGCPENPTANPTVMDGQTYANPQNGTAFAAANTAGNDGFTQSGNTLTVPMAGLTRVVKIVKTGSDAASRRVVAELS